MNIDDEIEKLNKERDALLIEVVKTRNTINELARKIRSLETVKRHASEILNSKGSSNIVLTKEEEISGDFVKDPAQLDLEVENPEMILPNEGLKIGDTVEEIALTSESEVKQAAKKIQKKKADQVAIENATAAIDEALSPEEKEIRDFLNS